MDFTVATSYWYHFLIINATVVGDYHTKEIVCCLLIWLLHRQDQVWDQSAAVFKPTPVHRNYDKMAVRCR